MMRADIVIFLICAAPDLSRFEFVCVRRRAGMDPGHLFICTYHRFYFMEIRDAGVRSDPHCSASHLAYLHDRRNEGDMAWGRSSPDLRGSALEQKGEFRSATEVRTVVGICRRMGRVCISVVVGGRGRCKHFIILYAIIRHIADDKLASIPFSAVPLSYPGIRKKWSGATHHGALFVWVIYDFAFTSASEREAIVSPNVEGNPATIAEGLKPGLRAPDFR